MLPTTTSSPDGTKINFKKPPVGFFTSLEYPEVCQVTTEIARDYGKTKEFPAVPTVI